MVIKIAETPLQTKFGIFQEVIYYDGVKEAIALVKGDITNGENVLCRIHSSCISAHVFNSTECDCREQMLLSQYLIEKDGKGIIIWLDQEGKGNGHFALVKSVEYKNKGLTQTEAYAAMGFKKDARDFTRAGEIIKDLTVKSIRLLTNNPSKLDTLKEFCEIAERVPLIIDDSENEHLRKTLKGKSKDGHWITLED